MKSNTSQKQQIVNKLRETGYVSRNWALSIYISRLGAIIEVLEGKGWKFNAHYEGSDYVYDLVHDPDNLKTEKAPANDSVQKNLSFSYKIQPEFARTSFKDPA